MADTIPEPDWKRFRRLHPIALDRFCERTVAEIAADSGRTSLERFVAISARIRERDRLRADLFDDFRRSTAFMQLALLNANGLLTTEERAEFTPEAREVLQRFNPDW